LQNVADHSKDNNPNELEPKGTLVLDQVCKNNRNSKENAQKKQPVEYNVLLL
jgi:hypothetical protein